MTDLENAVRLVLAALPKHEAALHLTHNQHKSYHMTVEECVADKEAGYSIDGWASDEEREKAIATNDCWTLQWYPHSPVGFCDMAAHSLEALIEHASRADS